MLSISDYTDNELRQAAGIAPINDTDVSSMSNDDLMRIAQQPADDNKWDAPIIPAKDIEERFNLVRQFAGPDIEKRARDSSVIAATFNIPESTAFDMRESFLQKMDTSNLWDKAAGSFKAGWGDVYSSVGGIMKRKGLAAGDIYFDFGERLKRSYIPPSDQSEFTWRKMKDPEWYATTIMRSVPFTVSLIPAAIVGAYAGTTAAVSAGLGTFGQVVLGSIGGAALSRPVESAFEAQGAYEEAKQKGFNDVDAESAADEVFWDNMKLSGVDAAEFALAFLPMGKIAGSTVKRTLGKRVLAATGQASVKLGGVGTMEMFEERYQEKAVLDAIGDGVSLFDFDNPRLNEAGAAGAVFGVGLGGAGSVWTALKDKVIATDNPKVKFTYNNAKAGALADGASVVDADRIALDAVAATPEGKAHIESVVGDLVDLANGNPAKEKTKTTSETNDNPFIFGVNEDANGDVTSFTMADPQTGQTFEVPAIKKTDGAEGNIIKITPDPVAITEGLNKIREKAKPDDIDTQIDKMIQGEEDKAEKLFDIAEPQGVEYNNEIQSRGRYSNNSTSEVAESQGAAIPNTGRADAYPIVGRERVATYKAAKTKITSADDLASLADANIGNQTQEHLISVTTDKNGKILSVYRHVIGTANQSVITPALIVGQALSNPNAAYVWIAHNHPSGGYRFSPGDRGSKNKIENLLRGTNVQIGDFIAIGDGKYDGLSGVEGIIPTGGNKKIAVTGRVFLQKGNQTAFTDESDIKKFATDNNIDGIILINNQNKPVGVIEGNDFSTIRGEVQERLLKEIEKRNATGMVFVRRNNPVGVSDIDNIKKFALAADLPILDIIDEKIGSHIEARHQITATGKIALGNDTVFYSGLDITQTLDVLKGLKGNIQEAMPHLEAVGHNVYQSGKVKFNEWSASMKETLGDLWEQFKDMMEKVWQSVKSFNENLGERGSFSTKSKAQNLVTRIKELGGLKFSEDYNTKWLKEDKDLKRILNNTTGKPIDTVANQLTEEGWPLESSDHMIEVLKSGEGRTMYAPEKADKLYNRDINRAEKEWADEQLDEIKKELEIARKAFAEGKKEGLEQSREKLRWMIKRRETMKNVRDYFKLTDSEMSKITRKNPILMDDADFNQYLRDVQEKAVLLQENKQAKIELMVLIEDRRLQKVDNYRKALTYPPISEMTTTQLREFADLLEPCQEDDVFLTQRELETVDKTDLKGIRTWREARERLAVEAGVPIEKLSNVKVEALDSYRWDSALRERDPFFDLLVSKMTESVMGAELRSHNIETQVFDLANKSDKSRSRTLGERIVPQDEQIMNYLEAPAEMKNAVAQEMTADQLNYAHFIEQYFAQALEYLIATKAVDRGRENYFVHIRKSFLENVKDNGIKTAISEIFRNYQEDQIGFNILDDDTGNILPLEKFFQFALHRTGELEPTKNVTRAFLTYMRTFEKKKMFDAIIPKLDIYTQSLTPQRLTARGLEFDSSLKKFVNKYINNKKGRRISYDSAIRQGGPVDAGIRALRTFTTILDLGFSIPTGIASFVGEQVSNFEMLGVKGYTKGTALMRTDKGKRILEKYESFTGRSFWENFTAPGKESTERLMESMFGLFHVASVTANKQYLLASMTEAEYETETINTARLAEMRLEMGRFRVVPGTSSLVGSTSLGDTAVQYKGWAIPIARSLTTDMAILAKDIKNKKVGEALTTREAKELFRLVGLTATVLIVGSMAGADKEDRTYLGKLKSRVYREAETLTQSIDPKLWLATPRTLVWLAKTGEALHNIITLEAYKTKPGLKGVGQMKQQLIPGAVRGVVNDKKSN